jgi:hypothetical protein
MILVMGLIGFAKCKIVICHNCFLNLLELNDSIEYCCPQCRHISIKNKDKRLTKFINKKCLEKMVELFEKKLEQTNARQLSNSWEEFNRRVSQEIYPIIHFDYDAFIPDN